MNNIGIYIHIPFCKSKCFYCDFCSKVPLNNGIIESYINAVCKEIIESSELLTIKNINTIYFGGGTPSLINSKYIVKIMELLKLYSSEYIEATIEVNPGSSCTREKLLDYLNCGINRISIGLQSANNTTLKNIGRVCTVEDFKRAYDLAVDVGFKNISCDVIFGLPNETLEMFSNTIDYILSLKHISHISAYSLEIHKNIKLDFLIKNGFLTLPSEDTEREMKYLMDEKLKQHRFNAYEISNYSVSGYESKHNIGYWTGVEYIGFGVAASSYIGSTRYTNINNVDTYIENVQNGKSVRSEIEELDKLDTIKEYIILHLRLTEGFSVKEFELLFKESIMNLFGDKIKKLINQGLLEKVKDNLRLTYKGQDVANIVWQEFI